MQAFIRYKTSLWMYGQMVLRIAVWGVLFHGILVLVRDVLPSGNERLRALLFLGGTWGSYLIFLYWEIRARIKRADTQKQLRWAGFYFTFGVGSIWGMYFGASVGHHPLLRLYDPVALLVGISFSFLWGIMLGIFGMAITQFMVLFVFKQPEQI